MGRFDVRVFLTHCFIPSSLHIVDAITIEPFHGIGVMDIADLIDVYLEERLKQPQQPPDKKLKTSKTIQNQGASVILTFFDLRASNHIEAIKSTEGLLLLCRDVLALRQMQRGYVSGFLSIQCDISPPQLYVQIRRPYPLFRKVTNLPFFESETDIFFNLFQKAKRDLRLRIYLSLYADAVSYSDTLLLEISKESHLLKTWVLLETMASSEPGTKKQKVKSLFTKYQISKIENYKHHLGQDLLDFAYKWRNVIVHCGGCDAATRTLDIRFCQENLDLFDNILEDLNQSCRFLIHAYANSLD